ncbi:reverse transcriptase family protein [Rhizobium leguminosarum]|uniref:reverse transcriptase family protein n=1 Tax=Rhizobium leguminosarum TaxID=384 RepID=UPI0015DA0D0E|nr:reverse transcriptase family protein [Rhizobium leguminosarum]NZD49166.1 RNA-directed DNA polymerase [Rhizobium leguminosarum]
MPRRPRRPVFEKYDISKSPFAQRPTQRDLGELLGENRNNLRLLVDYKEQFVVRRQEVIGKHQKVRDLKYPVSRLRAVHERLKFHLNKIKQPSYLFSPRKNRGQRDNALRHVNQDQYLTLDLKQFYPSTTATMVRRWFQDELGMYPDVAGLLTHLSTIDDRVSFGSPLTPVLCTLIHRAMFDEIAGVCERRGLRCTLWVDDLTISGKFIPGELVNEIREIIRAAGLRSHKVRYRTGNRPVFITGIGVVGTKLTAPNAVHLKIKSLWDDYHQAETLEEKESCSQLLLSQLGSLKHIVGAASLAGRKASDQMNTIRQQRRRMHVAATAAAAATRLSRALMPKESPEDVPFEIS